MIMRRSVQVPKRKIAARASVPKVLFMIIVSLPMLVVLFLMSRVPSSSVEADTTKSSIHGIIHSTGINHSNNKATTRQKKDAVVREDVTGFPQDTKREENPRNISLVECTVINPLAQEMGLLEITVRHDLSPMESAAFVHLVQERYYDGVFIFRVLKGFVAQWGNRKTWDGYRPLKTDKDVIVHKHTLSNVRGTLSFTGGNPAVRQVFVNMGDNRRLDKENSRPFATVSKTSMTAVIDKLYSGYKDGQGQVKAIKEGDEAVMKQFPNMSHIEQCHVVLAFTEFSGTRKRG